MKIKNGKELIGKFLDGKTCTTIYKVVGGVVYTLWEYIRSCFGRGFWVNDKNWSNTDNWKNF
jgi:hypothetical protein